MCLLYQCRESDTTYDNLADVVIQALRFATNIGFDVLVFLVIDALGNPHKDRMKEDGANAADWLQSMFCFEVMLTDFNHFGFRSRNIQWCTVPPLQHGFIVGAEVYCSPIVQRADLRNCCS